MPAHRDGSWVCLICKKFGAGEKSLHLARAALNRHTHEVHPNAYEVA